MLIIVIYIYCNGNTKLDLATLDALKFFHRLIHIVPVSFRCHPVTITRFHPKSSLLVESVSSAGSGTRQAEYVVDLAGRAQS